jgi:hypothetical protein
MKYLTAPLTGLLITLASLLCPVLMLLALPCIRWDDTPSTGQWGTHFVIRGSLPRWLSWLETPDERLPGGLYEESHLELYERYGKWVASYVWLGWRNRLHGLAYSLGHETTGYKPDDAPQGLWERGDDWQYVKQLGPLRFVAGWQIYALADRYWAVPVLSIKSRPQ